MIFASLKKIAKLYYARKKTFLFVARMKAQQLRSSDVLGKVSMYGDLLDVDSRSVVSEGIPSLSSLKIIVSALMNEQGRSFSSGLAVDCGANIGTYSIYFSQFFSRVVAFEPFPPTYHLLRLNVNGIENIEIRETALSSDCGKGVMARYRQFHSGSASLLDSDLKRNVGERFIVTKSTLDSELCNQPLPIKLIKIDVEGNELEVLKGATTIIKRDRPAIVFEYNDYNPLLLELLSDLGYSNFLLPTPSLLKTFSDRKALLKFLRHRAKPFVSLIQMYSQEVLVPFDAESMVKCELCLSLPSDK
jgi:FkbM family methyltransferase